MNTKRNNKLIQCITLADYDVEKDKVERQVFIDELRHFCNKVNIGESMLNELLLIPLDVEPQHAKNNLKYYPNGLSSLLNECLNSKEYKQEFTIACRTVDRVLVIVIETFKRCKASYEAYVVAKRPNEETVDLLNDDPINFIKMIQLAYLKG